MTLLKYELKKLLFNKARLMLLAALFLLYGFLAFVLSADLESKLTPEYSVTNTAILNLFDENSGAFDRQLFDQSKEIVALAYAEYGSGNAMEAQMRTNAELIFATKYVGFGNQVERYYAELETIRSELSELETDSYEYKYRNSRLEKELQFGEPVFARTGLWSMFFIMFDGMFLTLLLLMALTFFIAPLFTQEVKTDMDSIVLCSVKGRKEIVTAKLSAAAIVSAILAFTYLSGSLIGMYLGNGDFSGFNAPVRCLEIFPFATLDITVGTLFFLSLAWIVFTTVVFGTALAFISSKMKTQAGAFGLGIVILMAGFMTGNLPKSLYPVLWWLEDFNFASLAMFNTIFGSTKAYNFFKMPMSYGVAAFAVCIGLSALACLLTYLAQRKRTVV